MEVSSWGKNHTHNHRKPKLLDRVKMACFRRNYSPKTASSYVYWCRQYILFHNKRHPAGLNKTHIEAFLNYLIKSRHLSASTQSQALNALFFMYKQVLAIEPGWMEQLDRPKRKQRLPVVLSQNEVTQTLNYMQGTPKLMAQLIYGSGLRVNECMKLRIMDIDFDRKTITVRNGKGGKNRCTVLPTKLIPTLQEHLLKVMTLHKDDCLAGDGHAPLPY